ncbi:DUF6541 family protein [Actinophytocola gossypii]|uniref:Copper-transporting ATPase n=1 Tax=Actinophytocola gossypii TaxID=2812003 RepID=A0ABT2JFN5_9PSEU|nr:DUF6541 family protein [Actinophytocola gossypii]MCT2586688.1 hypothetical protein [Actinophytocola gossypii]
MVLSLGDVGLILLYVAVLWVPGTLLGTLAGIRGWTLAAAAPLLTYTVAGLAGPWANALGISWSVWTFLGALALFAVVIAGVRLARGRGLPFTAGSVWPWRAQLGVAACVAAALVVSIAAVAGGMGGLSTIPQDWDAAWHANNIRWTADTGESGLYSASQLNWFESDTGVFYPNAYHLIATLVYTMSGASIVAVLNAHTVLIPALIALVMVAVVRRFGGRAVLAGTTALVIVGITSVYDMLWRGPLLPFATGVAFTPLLVVLILDLLDVRARHGWRQALLPGFVVAFAGAGIITVHSSATFNVPLFTLCALAVRWWRAPRAIGRDVVTLVPFAVVAAALAVLQLMAALGSSADVEGVDWKATHTIGQAVGNLLIFQHHIPFPEWWFAAALAVGLAFFRRLGDLRWVGITAAGFGMLFVVAAAYDQSWADDLTRPWWNDRWRLIALAAIPLAVIVAHGVAETQRVVGGWISAAASRVRVAGRPAVAGLTSAVLVLGAFAVLTGGFYVDRNQTRMTLNATPGKAVSAAEVEGYRELAKLVGPDERVLNDRGDGSVWMYAVAGVHPVAGHYDATLTGPDARLLARKFDEYDTNPEVRAAVERLDVRWVAIGQGFLRRWAERQPGLRDLDRVDALTRVYENEDFVIYRLRPDTGETSNAAADG